MRGVLFCLFLLMSGTTAFASDDLRAAIENARAACGGISNDLSHMKTMAGINTAITGVGTVAGGVALGTGLAKVKVDKQADELEATLNKLRELANAQVVEQPTALVFSGDVQGGVVGGSGGDMSTDVEIADVEYELAQKTKQSKSLGNWRTGMLATSTATNIAGAVIAGNNRVKGDLKSQINECLNMVNVLSNVRMQVRVAGGSDDAELAQAEKIVRECGAWSTVDVGSINSKSTGATVASGVGAGLGLAGTITSATANSNSVRMGDSQKEKNLNTASNVLAGGTTVASGVAVVFNATQIGAIKRAANVADECEEALR
ncbi:MAG: hypothetical protein J6L47_03290 [Alphaproteobacteria bacterium]|nr:hypothetical protein [Alphaproteobacteria bacterium]